MEQTSIEWLINEFKTLGIYSSTLKEKCEEAKEMEKEHLCKMYIQGRKDNHLDYYPEKHANETYNEFFKKD